MNRVIKCHDCGASEGEIHSFGCDMEDCPFCRGQLITCGCCYKLLHIDVSEGTWAYEHGLTKEQRNRFIELMEEKGRIPYVYTPVLCVICGEDMSHEEIHESNIPDEDWDKYIIPTLQPKVLCKSCIERQKQLFPNGWRNVKRHD